MTRDRQRDLEALGVALARYCNLCNLSITVEDERTEEQDWQAQVARHREGEKRKR